MRYRKLADMSEREMNLVATIVSGVDARVVISGRLKQRAAVAYKRRTIVLDHECGPYDLILCAALLSRRREALASAVNGRVPRRRVRSMVHAERQHLLARFPRLEVELAGKFHPSPASVALHRLLDRNRRGADLLPELSLDEVELRPSPLSGPGKKRVHSSMSRVFGKGVGRDIDALVRAIEQGQIDLEYLPELREMPVIVAPLTVADAGNQPPERWEQICQEIKSVAGHIGNYMTCYAEHAQDAEETPGARQLTAGVRIDPRRLVGVHLARRTGLPPRIFHKPLRYTQTVFRPENHLVAFGFDAQSLCPGTLADPAVNRRLILAMVQGFIELGVNLQVHGFWDEVIGLSDGRPVYLHQPMLLKRSNEEADGTFWSRMERLLYLPRQAFSRTVRPCFSPLHFRTMARALNAAAAAGEGAITNFALDYVGTGVLRAHGVRPTDEFLSRTADAIDRVISSVERQHPGQWHNVSAIAPAIIEHGRPSGPVSNMLRHFG